MCGGSSARCRSSSHKQSALMPTVAVVGLGLMGSSFVLALNQARPDMAIVGSDRNPIVVRKALDRGIVSTANTDLVEAVVGRPVVMDATTQDKLVAGVSHAAFLLSVGYVLAMSRRKDWPEASKLAAGGFRDMSRLAAGDPDLYSGVARTNRENLLEMLDAISQELGRLYRHLETDDPRLVELFEEARAVRERWANHSPGFTPPPGGSVPIRPGRSASGPPSPA